MISEGLAGPGGGPAKGRGPHRRRRAGEPARRGARRRRRAGRSWPRGRAARRGGRGGIATVIEVKRSDWYGFEQAEERGARRDRSWRATWRAPWSSPSNSRTSPSMAGSLPAVSPISDHSMGRRANGDRFGSPGSRARGSGHRTINRLMPRLAEGAQPGPPRLAATGREPATRAGASACRRTRTPRQGLRWQLDGSGHLPRLPSGLPGKEENTRQRPRATTSVRERALVVRARRRNEPAQQCNAEVTRARQSLASQEAWWA